MRKIIGIFIAALFLIAVFFFLKKPLVENDYRNNSEETPQSPDTEIADKTVDISLTDGIAVIIPTNDDTLTITGSALGTMFFEASFPVRFEDADKNIIAQGIAQANGEWMTTSSVPFTAKLKLNKPIKNSISGELVFARDNPSGLKEYDLEIRIPAFIIQ